MKEKKKGRITLQSLVKSMIDEKQVVGKCFEFHKPNDLLEKAHRSQGRLFFKCHHALFLSYFIIASFLLEKCCTYLYIYIYIYLP